jgi:hypothetical protein
MLGFEKRRAGARVFLVQRSQQGREQRDLFALALYKALRWSPAEPGQPDEPEPTLNDFLDEAAEVDVNDIDSALSLLTPRIEATTALNFFFASPDHVLHEVFVALLPGTSFSVVVLGKSRRKMFFPPPYMPAPTADAVAFVAAAIAKQDTAYVPQAPLNAVVSS